MDLACERCRTKKFRVTLGATCAYVICLRCGQEFGTVAEDLAGRPAVVVVPVVSFGGYQPGPRICPNPWHDAPLEARLEGTCIDCGARLAPASATGEPLDGAVNVICPTCHARPGERCYDLAGRTAPGVLSHRARARVWEASRGMA